MILQLYKFISCHFRLVSFLCLFLSFIQPSFAVDISAKIKASYIYNFLQFITFQQDAIQSDGRLNVCVVGENSFGGTLNSLEGESTPQAKLHFVYVKDFSNTTSVKSCNVLFLTKSAKNATKQILSAVDNKDVVTIADYSPFVTEGGLIELFSENGKILFRINTDLLKDAHFKVAAQLIQLGRN